MDYTDYRDIGSPKRGNGKMAKKSQERSPDKINEKNNNNDPNISNTSIEMEDHTSPNNKGGNFKAGNRKNKLMDSQPMSSSNSSMVSGETEDKKIHYLVVLVCSTMKSQ